MVLFFFLRVIFKLNFFVLIVGKINNARAASTGSVHANITLFTTSGDVLSTPAVI